MARVLAAADQLVLVAPASADAAQAVTMTMEWLDGHGYGDLVTNAITVINGVSKRSMTHVEQAELVVRGRCRAIVRVPWDDHLGAPRDEQIAAAPGGRGRRGRVPVRAAAAAGAARLHRAGRGAGLGARGRTRPAARSGHMSSRTRGRSRLSLRYFDDRILLTETHAWAYYRLPTQPYEFTTPHDREALATNITVALAAIRMPDAEVHLRIVHRSYPAAEWAAQLDDTSDGGPGWRDYLDEMYRHVWAKDFWTKEVYLGVRLGQRGMGAQLSGGVFAQFLNAYRAGEQTMGLNDEALSNTEINRWTDHAERLGRALSASALAARHATSDEIAWLVRHTLMGTAGDPRPSAVAAPPLGAGRDRGAVRGPGAQRPLDPAAWRTRRGSRSRRSCPSPGSPT